MNKGILLEENSLVPKPGGYRFDVLHFPAENGALQGGEIRDFCEADLVPTDAHYQRILVQTHKLKPKLVFIKGARLVVIRGRNKPN